MRKRINFLRRIYNKLLGLFFEFDIGIYATSVPKIPTTRVFGIEYEEDVSVKSIETPDFACKTSVLKPPVVISYKTPSLMELLKLHDANAELFQSLKIREENLFFQLLTRNYQVELKANPNIFNIKLVFDILTKKAEKKEIYISHSLKTVEELLELEPYTHKYPVKNILEIPISKYPVKKEKFTEQQLELMKTKLAIQAKSKKYSMTIENIYDKFPVGLYDEIKIEKDGSIKCKFSKTPKAEELQLLITGKRKYDTQTTTAYIKYAELGLN